MFRELDWIVRPALFKKFKILEEKKGLFVPLIYQLILIFMLSPEMLISKFCSKETLAIFQDFLKSSFFQLSLQKTVPLT